MPSPSELLKSLQSTLNATIEHLDFLDQAEGKTASARETLASILRDIKAAETRRDTVKAELAKIETDLANKTNLVNDERARVLEETNRQITAKQEELKTLSAAVAKAQHNHDSVVADLNSLAQRIRV